MTSLGGHRQDPPTEAEVESDASSDSLIAQSEESEDSPLLADDLPSHNAPSKSFRRRVLLMCVLALFIVEISLFVMEAPLQKIMEDIICRNYYPDHILREPRIQDSRCKNTDVQKTLAMVRGWSLAVDMAAPMLAQFPFGIIADKYGRRPVLLLSLFGLLLRTIWIMVVLLFPNTFSIWATLPASLFFLIGGGVPMAGAMIWTIVADVIPVAERTSMFYKINAASLTFNVIVNPISALLMKHDPWIAVWLGLGLLIIGTFSPILIPETLTLQQKVDARHRHEQAAHGVGTVLHGADEPVVVDMSKHAIIKQAWFTVRNDIGHVRRFIFASKTVMVLILCFGAFSPIRMSYTYILLQYLSKRFDWDWSKATYVSTIGILFNILGLLVFLPIISAVISKRYKLSTKQRDLVLTRASILVAAAGSLLMAFAAVPWLFFVSLIIANLGNGFVPLCRALLNAVVEPHTIATLNTTISLVEMLAGLVSGPAMGWLLSRGMEMGGGEDTVAPPPDLGRVPKQLSPFTADLSINSITNAKMSISNAKVLSTGPLPEEEARWTKLVKTTYADPKGVTRTWEHAERRTRPKDADIDGVGILAILDKPAGKEILLQKQYRPPLDKIVIEVPAGLIDEGETAEQAAVRELKEETGYVGVVTESSPIMYNDPGFCNTNLRMVHVTVDMNLPENKNPITELEENEFIEVFTVPVAKLWDELKKFEAEGCAIDARVGTFAEGILIAQRMKL
ncbi:hypothetical protein G7046_g7408 [Stylonectria norvegica]|nr:hypothetical protein G7046_g7408 [Stylonectria norvegica]